MMKSFAMRFHFETDNHSEVMDMLNLGGIKSKILEKTTWDIKGVLSSQYIYEMSFAEEKFKAAIYLADGSGSITVTEGRSRAVYDKLLTLFEKESEYSDNLPAPPSKSKGLSLYFFIFTPIIYGIYNLFFR